MKLNKKSVDEIQGLFDGSLTLEGFLVKKGNELRKMRASPESYITVRGASDQLLLRELMRRLSDKKETSK